MTSPTGTERWTVKQIKSVDSVIVHAPIKNQRPVHKTIILSNIKAPKLARPKTTTAEETKDEPWAWEAREFLRKKLIGQDVILKIDSTKQANATGDTSYGAIYLGNDIATGENITKSLIAEGFVDLRGVELKEAYDKAVAAKKGKHDPTAVPVVRDIQWTVENMANFLDKYKKPIPAIIEQVRDGSTVRALLMPEPTEFIFVNVLITGIRCPSKEDPDLGDEAMFFVEKRLLQRDVEIILESRNNNNFVGTIIHPKGNIAEVLLRDGFAHCVDWSIALLKTGADKYRAAQKEARDNKRRWWKNHQPSAPQLTGKEKEFTGTVVEVIGGDALMVKVASGQPPRKIFLASVRPPKSEEPRPAEGAPAPEKKTKVNRPLYDIPWLFEAREFLRKKLIGKKVNVVVDYKQPAVDNFPEKTCCTVTIGGVNVAEVMISKGLGRVVRYKANDDQRSSHYDDLMSAETKASKSFKGVFAKKDIPQRRVNDVSGDSTRARQFLSSLQRSGRVEAVVEFVTSGSRLRLYIPKEMCLITFLLAGINCPRGARPATASSAGMPGDPYGEEALQFTKDKCMQHEVEIQVDNIDKVRGNFIGWLFVQNENLSEALVREGLASVHFSAEKTDHYRALKAAEDSAKANKEKIWKDYVPEEVKEEKPEEEVVTERKVDHQTVVVVEATKDLKVYVQNVDQGPKLEALMEQIRQEFQTNPPLPGAFTPRKGDICAAKFSDDQWYRARVEKVIGSDVHVFYIDYGNKEVTQAVRCASLPSNFTTDKPYANEFGLAFIKLPKDADDQEEAVQNLKNDLQGRTCLLNIEYRIEKTPYVTLTDKTDKVDLCKALVRDGLILVEVRKDRRLAKLMSEYRTAQDEAKNAHLGIWQYGDITEDDAKEFGR